MTPSPGSVQLAAHPANLQHSPDDATRLPMNGHFADGHWTSDARDTGSVWTAASYWVRRKRAQSGADLSS